MGSQWRAAARKINNIPDKSLMGQGRGRPPPLKHSKTCDSFNEKYSPSFPVTEEDLARTHLQSKLLKFGPSGIIEGKTGTVSSDISVFVYKSEDSKKQTISMDQLTQVVISLADSMKPSTP